MGALARHHMFHAPGDLPVADVSVRGYPGTWPRYSERVTRGKVETENRVGSNADFAIWCKGETKLAFWKVEKVG
jgi:hypothetical protein